MTPPPKPSHGMPVLAWCSRLWDYVLTLQVVAGPGLTMRRSRNGTVISLGRPPGSGPGAPEGAFFSRYKDEDGHTMLLGGTVTGGHGGSATLPDRKILDATTGVGSLAGKILVLKANVTVTTADGVMLPGAALNSATITEESSPPANHAFTVAAPTGHIHAELGRWTDSAFLPSGIGSFLATACLGNAALERQPSGFSLES